MIFLHKNKDLFAETVQGASDMFGLYRSYIEKDYYITLVLKYLAARFPDLMFKGGTALSKVYGVIQRFSEDIDITFRAQVSQSTKTKLKHNGIMAVSEILGMTIPNIEFTHSRKRLNQYFLTYNVVTSPGMIDQIKLETSYFQVVTEAHPRKVHSYIELYLQETNPDLIQEYGLEPFTMWVQDLERTFVDKVFAVCDYYLKGSARRNSRHIYDLYMIMPHLKTQGLKRLIKEVRIDRQKLEKNKSAVDSVDIPNLLREIAQSNFYKQDYIDTLKLFPKRKPIPFETIATCLPKIADSHLFDWEVTNK